MAPRFYSKEWVDATVEKANNDKDYLKKTENFTASYLVIITDFPDGNDIKILFKFDKGKVQYEYEAKPSPASFRVEDEPWDPSVSLFRVQGNYDTYARLHKKEMTSMQALSAKMYKTDGDLTKVMSLTVYSQAWSEIQASVDCEF